MPFHTHRLPNGLQLIGETNPSARSVAVGFFVRTGARDESPELAGVSHFLEHMMFKGTPRRSAKQVNLDFDRIGADSNAYTSEESTVYHATALPEYLPDAVDILADILRPSLRDDDYAVEKGVILNEIKQYDDDPDSCAADHTRRIYYRDHPLGNSVLGTIASITALTRDQMHGYFAARYAAPNVVAAAAGNFDWDEFTTLVGAACGHWGGGAVGRVRREPWDGAGGLHVLTRDTVQQEYVTCLSAGPPADSPLRYAGDVLSMVVGDVSGSRLYWELVDPGLAAAASSAYLEYDANGLVWTALACDPEQTEANIRIVRDVIADVQAKGVTEDEVRLAKSKIASRVVRGSERPMGRMQAIASAWMYTGAYRDVDTELANYDAVTVADVRAYLTRYPLDRLTAVAFGPAKQIAEVPGRAV